MQRYDDIIEMKRHVSLKHPSMSREDRAAQFAPFSALNGHKETIIESERIVDEKIVLDENKLSILNRILNIIKGNIKQKPQVVITYFEVDSKKEGGKYLTVGDTVKKIDEYDYIIILENGLSIEIENIYNIEIV